MASEINRAYHAELRKAQYRLVGHGLRSNAEQALRNRNPDFRGTVINPVNAGPRVFFGTKDEARVPWKDLINVDFLPHSRKMRGGGVEPSVTGAMATPQGRQYAKTQLERKAMDLEMIRSMMPMPIENMAQASAVLDDVQRRKLDIELTIRQVLDAMGDGSADGFTVDTLRRIIPSITELVPYLSATDILEIRNQADEGIEIGRDVPDAYTGTETNARARDALTVLLRKISMFCDEASKQVGVERDQRKKLARALANRVFKADNEAEVADEDIPPQANDPEIKAEQLRDEATEPVRLPAERRRAAPAAVSMDVTPESLARAEAFLRKGTPQARIAFSQIWDEWSANPELKRLLPRGAKNAESRNIGTLRKPILEYMRRNNRFPSEDFARAVARSRRR